MTGFLRSRHGLAACMSGCRLFALPLALVLVAPADAVAQDAPAAAGGGASGAATAPTSEGGTEASGSAPRGAAAGRRLTITTAIEASETYNETRSSALAERNGVDFVTRVSPSLRLNLQSGRLQGNASWVGSASHHSRDSGVRDSEPKAFQQNLNSNLTAELVEGHVFFDGRAGISQQALSAFDRQSAPDSVAGNANRTEVGSLYLSPSFRSRISDWAKAEFRLVASGTNGRDSIAADSTTLGASVSLASAGRGLGLGWAFSANHQTTDPKASRETVNDRVNASLTWRPDIDWEFSANAGQEDTDVGGLERRRYDNWGLGLRWTPSPRTELSLNSDRRFFGDGWRFVFQHRTPRTVWRYSTTRDVSNGSDPAGVGQPQTAYQLLFAQFASRFPDPVEREQAVRDFLRALGIPAESLVSGGSVNGAISLQERHDLSAAWTGRRASVTVSAFSSDTRVLDTVSAVATDPGRTQLWGWNVALGWRLTPQWSISLLGSRQLVQGNASNPGNELKSVTASLSGQLGPRTTLGLNGRYSVFNSPRDPYRETALGASLGLRF